MSGAVCYANMYRRHYPPVVRSHTMLNRRNILQSFQLNILADVFLLIRVKYMEHITFLSRERLFLNKGNKYCAKLFFLQVSQHYMLNSNKKKSLIKRPHLEDPSICPATCL